MTPPRPIHVEQLFATPIVTASASSEFQDAAIADAAELLAGKVDGRNTAATRSWDNDWPAALDPVVAHARALAVRQTTDRAGGAAPDGWSAQLLVDVADGRSALELAPAYEAFWRAVHIVTPNLPDLAAPALAGEWIMTDPRLPAPMMEMPSLRLRLAAGASAPVYRSEVECPVRDAQWLLAPGWLRIAYRPPAERARRYAIVSIALMAPVDSRADQQKVTV